MDKLPPQLQFDKELNKYPLAVEFEKRTNIPKVFVASALGFVFFLLIFLNIWGDLLTNLLGFVYPAYASFKALETTSTKDDVHWLTYWVVFGFFNLIEFFSDILLFWLPFYYFFKAAIILWLVLPQTMGANFVYSKIIRPFLVAEQNEIDASLDKFKNKVSSVITEEIKKNE
ncbi:hypothetical protein HDV04_005089 [Boothiomyces sp. JEL0838]|nr:hypothetical protein HDV04_005089 [Boothiomyces sp. JEL0838]